VKADAQDLQAIAIFAIIAALVGVFVVKVFGGADARKGAL